MLTDEVVKSLGTSRYKVRQLVKLLKIKPRIIPNRNRRWDFNDYQIILLSKALEAEKIYKQTLDELRVIGED